jgi:uncharacterized protein YecE (DUF72 family)
MSIRCGVAGWDYASWNGTVYPARPGRGFDKLAYLARFVRAVEINRTYYRPATADEARSWIARAGEHDLVFTAKLPEVFVAPGKAWTRDDVREARAGFDVMHEAGRLPAALLQFAYSFRRVRRDGSVDARSREWLRDALAAFPGLPLFVEFRHESWDSPDVLAELAELGAGFVNVDMPRLPRDSMPLTAHATTKLGYLRLHGRNYRTWMKGQSRATRKTAENVEARRRRTAAERREEEAQKDARFDYLYPGSELAELARVARTLAGEDGEREVITVNNNHFAGEAPANAIVLQSILDGAVLAAPAGLIDTYPDAMAGHARPDPAG